MPQIYLATTDKLHLTADIIVTPHRYRYFFLTKQQIELLEFIANKVSAGKGLNYAKTQCKKWERVA